MLYNFHMFLKIAYFTELSLLNYQLTAYVLNGIRQAFTASLLLIANPGYVFHLVWKMEHSMAQVLFGGAQISMLRSISSGERQKNKSHNIIESPGPWHEGEIYLTIFS
jgi:hypothetical protein